MLTKICKLAPQLLSRGDKIGETPLTIFANFQDAERYPAVQSLLGAVADSQAAGTTRLHVISKNSVCHTEKGLKLLDIVVNPHSMNDVDSDGCTAMHYICKQGCTAALRLLMEKGMFARTFDNRGRAAMHYAMERPEFNNDVATTMMLARYSSEGVKARDVEGMTPLHVAAKCGQPLSCQALVDFQPNMAKIKDNHKCFPVHYAVLHENFETTVGVRIAAKLANPPTLLFERNSKGNTPLSKGRMLLIQALSDVASKYVLDEERRKKGKEQDQMNAG